MINSFLKELDLSKYLDVANHFWLEPLGAEQLRYILEQLDVFWIHDGNPAHSHAELTGGGCSSGYANLRPLMERPDMCQILAQQVLALLGRNTAFQDVEQRITWVISSSYTATHLGYEVAKMMRIRIGCTQKDGKQQVWRGSPIGPNDLVLQVEDLNTTGGTIEAVRAGVREACPEARFASVIGLVVDRSDQKEVGGAELVPVAHYDITNWSQEDCPLCKAGSTRIRPNNRENWLALTRPI